MLTDDDSWSGNGTKLLLFGNMSEDEYNYQQQRCLGILQRLGDMSNSFYKYPSYWRLLAIILYSFVSCFGALGNLLVVIAVIRNSQMRIPRNYFIINLALSDFLMCTITVPFTAYMALNTFWNLGELSCKFVSMAQGINAFVSTMSITAIGMDRYWVIIFPTKINQQRLVILTCFALMWTVSVAFALPLFYATEVNTRELCGKELSVCSEVWSSTWMPFPQSVYTIGCMLFQYLLPLAMLTYLYSRIIGRLKGRMVFNRQISQFDTGRRRSVELRQRRMNSLLVCIVLIFAVSWLPLNIFNALIAFGVKYEVAAFAFCHIVGMTSACANPVLYGVLNENFRAEFVAIFTDLRIVPLLRVMRNCCFGVPDGATIPGRRRSRRDSRHHQPTASNGVLIATNEYNSRVPTPTLIEGVHSTISQHNDGALAVPEETVPLCRHYLTAQDAYSKHYPKNSVAI